MMTLELNITPNVYQLIISGNYKYLKASDKLMAKSDATS